MIARLQDVLLSVIASNPVLERLAAASIDLVVVTALVAAIVALARVRSRRVIVLLWMVALVKPVLSLAVGAPAPLIPIATPSPNAAARSAETTVIEEETVLTDTDGRMMTMSQESTQVKPDIGGSATAGTAAGRAAAGVWAAGVLLMLGMSVAARVRLRRVIAASTPAGDDVRAVYDRVSTGFRRGRRPPVRVTGALESPALAGTLRPVILLPEWIADPVHAERLEWALRHELAHWSARDHLVALAAETSRALFFFHPVAWWAARRWKEAMEMACDESVVSSRQDVKRYAEQLYQILAHVDERRRLALSPSLFATRTQIGRRIESLLRSRRRMARPGVTAVAAVAAFALASFAFGADFAPPRPPQEVPPAPEATPVPGVASVPAAVPVPASGTAHYDNVNAVETSDDREVRLRAEGIVFDRATGRVVELDTNGFLRVSETSGDTERRVHITPGADGAFQYQYYVDGDRAEWDDAAQGWLDGILRTHLTRVRRGGVVPPVPATTPTIAPVAPVTPTPGTPPAPAVAPTPRPAPVPEAPPRRVQERDE